MKKLYNLKASLINNDNYCCLSNAIHQERFYQKKFKNDMTE